MSFGENFCIDKKEQFKAITYDFYVSVYGSKSHIISGTKYIKCIFGAGGTPSTLPKFVCLREKRTELFCPKKNSRLHFLFDFHLKKRRRFSRMMAKPHRGPLVWFHFWLLATDIKRQKSTITAYVYRHTPVFYLQHRKLLANEWKCSFLRLDSKRPFAIKDCRHNSIMVLKLI